MSQIRQSSGDSTVTAREHDVLADARAAGLESPAAKYGPWQWRAQPAASCRDLRTDVPHGAPGYGGWLASI